jgi:hypothetical protein
VSNGGTYIAPHRVTRDCLEPTNEIWPNGIGANADASRIELPLTLQWEIELSTWVLQPPIVVRDFVVVLLTYQEEKRSELVGLELTSGREYWRRQVNGMGDDRLVADLHRVYARAAGEWFAFDLESGEPSPIEVATLDPRLRQQLVLATVWTKSDFDDFATFTADLDPPAGELKLIAANRQCRVYAPFGLNGFSSTITLVSNGTFEVAGDPESYEKDLVGCAMTDRYLVLAQRDGSVRVIDVNASPPAVVQRLAIPARYPLTAFTVPVSVGSDHVVIARTRHVRCYRGART